ncbi:MAG: hypothetical protein Q8N94_06750 [Methanoregula sp.]|nr:hypothetical protein [Methanoregula sp.]
MILRELRRVSMFENELQTRAAICGTGILLGIVLVLTHLPLLILIVPIAVLFLGLVADPEETHAVWYGMLNTLGIFDLSALTDAERLNYSDKRHYFWFGEVGMAAMMAGVFAVPVGIFLAGRAEITLAFIGAAVLFLPLFVFLPKLIQQAMKADADAAIEAFGKNEQVKRVFWTLFVAMAGFVLARVVDPVTTQQVVAIITGMGV